MFSLAGSEDEIKHKEQEYLTMPEESPEEKEKADGPTQTNEKTATNKKRGKKRKQNDKENIPNKKRKTQEPTGKKRKTQEPTGKKGKIQEPTGTILVVTDPIIDLTNPLEESLSPVIPLQNKTSQPLLLNLPNPDSQWYMYKNNNSVQGKGYHVSYLIQYI